MCSGPEAGSYLRRIDFVYHSTRGLRVIKKKKTQQVNSRTRPLHCRDVHPHLPKLVFQAHRLLYHSTLGSRVIKKKRRPPQTLPASAGGTEAGSYLRLIDSCITQLKAQGPSRTCNESKEEEEEHISSERSGGHTFFFFSSPSSLLLSSLELSDTAIYEPYTRALLATASHFC